MMEIIFLRHGETTGNRRKNYIGRTDEPLCVDGEIKIRELVARGAYPAVDVLLVSPLIRCRQTAALIYPKVQAQVVADFAECDFGEFENKNWQDLTNEPAYQTWIDSGGLAAFPGGESRADFVARTRAGFVQVMAELLISNAVPFGARIGIVAHGGTIMAILSSFCGGEYYDYMTPNGGGWQAVLDEALWRQEKRLCRPKPLF